MNYLAYIGVRNLVRPNYNFVFLLRNVFKLKSKPDSDKAAKSLRLKYVLRQ